MTSQIIFRLALIISNVLLSTVHAGFICSTNAGGAALTVIGYTGSGGALTIPDKINDLPVTSIGNGAFGRHPNLTSLTISDNVTNIGEQAFTAVDSHSNLARITIGKKVASIGRGAFVFCGKLTEVTLPASVTSIGDRAFNGCFDLQRITVAADNAAYCSIDGVLYNKSRTMLVQFPPGKAGNYVIPDTVTNIVDMALWNCPGLAGITIPDGITRIENEAFAACNRLTNVVIPASVTSIGVDAFDSCQSLATIHFLGNAPKLDRPDRTMFNGIINPVIYYSPGTAGWGATFAGRPTALWQSSKGEP